MKLTIVKVVLINGLFKKIKKIIDAFNEFKIFFNLLRVACAR